MPGFIGADDARSQRGEGGSCAKASSGESGLFFARGGKERGRCASAEIFQRGAKRPTGWKRIGRASISSQYNFLGGNSAGDQFRIVPARLWRLWAAAACIHFCAPKNGIGALQEEIANDGEKHADWRDDLGMPALFALALAVLGPRIS